MPLTSRIFFGSSGVFFVVTASRRPATDLHTVGDAGEEMGAAHDRVLLLGAVVGDDGEDLLALLVLPEPDHARALGHGRRALGRAGLEQLDDPRQTVRDVLTGDAAGVERPDGELRAGLAEWTGRR